MAESHELEDPVILAKHRSLKNLDQVIKNGLGEPLMMTDVGRAMTVLDGYTMALAGLPMAPLEAVHAVALSMRLFEARGKPTLVVSIEDHALLKNALEKNPHKWGGLALGQMYSALTRE